MEETKKQLQAVLLSSKGGVALDQLEIDYFNLVCTIDGIFIHLVKQSVFQGRPYQDKTKNKWLRLDKEYSTSIYFLQSPGLRE